MAIMTIAAVGSILLPAGQSQPVHAGSKGFGLLFVAFCTIGRLRGEVVIGMLSGDIAVTTRATVGLMDRGPQLGLVDEHRNTFTSSIGFVERLIGVTLHARAVFDLARGKALKGE